MRPGITEQEAQQLRERVRDELRQGGGRRDAAEASREAAMDRIRRAIIDGRALQMPVNEMAELAGISRETAYVFIRESETTGG